MQESLYQTLYQTDAKYLYLRQETLYQTADAGVSLEVSIRQWIRQTTDAGDTLSDSG